MHLTRSIQDYLKAIYELQHSETPVSNGRLALYFAVSAPSITEMVKKMQTLQLVEYQAREGVSLTEYGEQLALEMIRHHRLVELYLVEALGMTWDEVHREAEILEHVLSETLEDRIAAFLGDPEFDPHGAPIPRRDGSLPARTVHPLVTWEPGIPAVIAQVDDRDPARLRYLGDLGLVPNTPIEVITRAPFDGPLTLEVGLSRQSRIIDQQLATRILVQAA